MKIKISIIILCAVTVHAADVIRFNPGGEVDVNGNEHYMTVADAIWNISKVQGNPKLALKIQRAAQKYDDDRADRLLKFGQQETNKWLARVERHHAEVTAFTNEVAKLKAKHARNEKAHADWLFKKNGPLPVFEEESTNNIITPRQTDLRMPPALAPPRKISPL